MYLVKGLFTGNNIVFKLYLVC